jgi:hypothetical protein
MKNKNQGNESLLYRKFGVKIEKSKVESLIFAVPFQFVPYKMTPNRLESLYRKRFKFPGDFSAADQLELEMCEQVAYTEKVNHMSTPQSNNMSQMSSDSGSTSSQSSSKSIISPYGECIATNRDIKREWSGIHLEDIAPLLDQSKSHFQSTANFHATFINFIRYEIII